MLIADPALTLQSVLPGQSSCKNQHFHLFWHKLLAIVADGRILSNFAHHQHTTFERHQWVVRECATECPDTQPLDAANFSQTAHQACRELWQQDATNGLLLRSEIVGSFLPSVRRTRSFLASEDAKSKPLRLISMYCKWLLDIFVSERLAFEDAMASPAKISGKSKGKS